MANVYYFYELACALIFLSRVKLKLFASVDKEYDEIIIVTETLPKYLQLQLLNIKNLQLQLQPNGVINYFNCN